MNKADIQESCDELASLLRDAGYLDEAAKIEKIVEEVLEQEPDEEEGGEE